MNALADFDGYKICIQVCVWLGFQHLWSLCSVVFHAFALRLPIQTYLPEALKIQFCLSSHEQFHEIELTPHVDGFKIFVWLGFQPWTRQTHLRKTHNKSLHTWTSHITKKNCDS